MRIKITVCYDGTDFCGWQIQPNGVSVQKVIEDAVYSVTGEKVTVTGSGRTDAGVHAEGQVADFAVQNSTIPAEKYAFALNVCLPQSVRVLKSESVADGFNSRESAKKKTYVYKMYKSKTENPLKERFAYRIEEYADVEEMKKVSPLFVGVHDFKGFNASKGGAKTTVREIYSAEIKEDGDEITFTVTGNGFLYNMVRIMAGAILRVGYKRATPEDVKRLIDTGERSYSWKTLPAKGLTLKKVVYE